MSDQNLNFNNYNGYNSDPFTVSGQRSGFDSLSTYMAKTFGWMAFGLALTFGIAYGIYQTGAINIFLANPLLLYALPIVQIGVVLVMSFGVNKLSVNAARACFLIYAALTGVTFSVYLVAYGVGIVLLAFLATALFFGGMAIVATVFKLDLSRIGAFLGMSLIFLIIFGIVAFITGLEALQIAECYLGIAIFIAFTAYDTTMIRRNYSYYVQTGDAALLKKASIFSALQLYLDFINLFIRILRIFGRNSRN